MYDISSGLTTEVADIHITIAPLEVSVPELNKFAVTLEQLNKCATVLKHIAQCVNVSSDPCLVYDTQHRYSRAQ